jgi:hypothetical protein
LKPLPGGIPGGGLKESPLRWGGGILIQGKNQAKETEKQTNYGTKR